MSGRKFITQRAVLAVAFILALLTTSVARADSLTLAWDANPESDVVGYYVFIGTASGAYSTVVDVGNATSYTFTSALPGTTYYLTVAAYIAGPVVGQHAPEVVTTTGGGPNLSNPGNRSSTRGTALTLALSATDPNNDPITFGAYGLPTGLTLDPTTGVISGAPTTAGAFNVAVTASDGSGYITTQYFVWTIVATDTTAPVIVISSPTSASTYASSAAFVTLSGTASDDVGVTGVTWANSRGGSGTAAGGASWSVIVPLQAGSNIITMTARDATGKSGAAAITVTVDFAPTVTITTPTSGSSYSSSAAVLSLGGTATDDIAISRVTWSNDRGGSGTATGTSSWSATGIALQSGTNVITVTAHDGTGHSSTARLTVSAPSLALQVVSVTADKASPQVAGTTVTFTTTALGGTAPYQFKWWLFDGSTWTLLRDWSSPSSLAWTPRAASANYRIGVWARNAGSTRDYAENDRANGAIAFSIGSSSTPLAVTSLTANKVSPQVEGTAITFTAAATGGTGPYSYKWRVFNGVTWSVAQSWSTTSTFTWTPTSAGSTYQIEVWARSNGSSTDAAENSNAVATAAFSVTAAATPLAVTSLTASKVSPQVEGTAITFTAAAAGGTGPLSYKWRVSNGTTWSVAQEWSLTSTFTWTPASAGSGYQVQVWARSSGSSTDAAENSNALATRAFAITAATTPLTLTSVTANKLSPQVEGAAITFTAAAAGGTGPYSYKWRVFNGTTRSTAQVWSTTATFVWTPTSAGSAYQVEVWARSSGNVADAAENGASATRPFAITTAPTSTGVLTVNSLTADKTAPQAVGTTITFTATTTGGSSSLQYKWWLFDGSVWVVVRDWSTASSVPWTPTTANSNYRIGVWVRNAGSTLDAFDNDRANRSLSFPVSYATDALALTSLTANMASPQSVGTSITFSAAAAGGTGPYSYKWRVFNGSSWTVVQGWSTVATFVWSPLASNSAYQVEVWVRSAGNSTDAPENSAARAVRQFSISYSTSSPLRLLAMTTDKASPQATGTPITVFTTVSGGVPQYQYKWWLFDGTSWSLLKDWSQSSSYTWTPPRPGSNYRIGVWVRSSTNALDRYDNDAANGSVQFIVQ